MDGMTTNRFSLFLLAVDLAAASDSDDVDGGGCLKREVIFENMMTPCYMFFLVCARCKPRKSVSGVVRVTKS